MEPLNQGEGEASIPQKAKKKGKEVGSLRIITKGDGNENILQFDWYRYLFFVECLIIQFVYYVFLYSCLIL